MKQPARVPVAGVGSHCLLHANAACIHNNNAPPLQAHVNHRDAYCNVAVSRIQQCALQPQETLMPAADHASRV
jgi:hypothetical protein